MIRYFRDFKVLFVHNMVSELLNRELIYLSVAFSLMLSVILAFATHGSSSLELTVSMYSVALIFTINLISMRAMYYEYQEGGINTILFSPMVDASAFVFAKGLTNFFYVMVVAVLMLPFYFTTGIFTQGALLGVVLLITAITMVGVAVITSFLAFMAFHTAAKEVLLFVLQLPFVLPVIMAYNFILGSVVVDGADIPWRMLTLLVGYDFIVIFIIFILFDFLIRD